MFIENNEDAICWRILQFIELQIDVHLIRMEYNDTSPKNLQINVPAPHGSRWIQTPGPGLAEMKDSGVTIPCSRLRKSEVPDILITTE